MIIKSGIYKIQNKVNGKTYIGSSCNINRRFWEHRKLLKANKHDNIHLQRSWNKHGHDNFIFDIIEIVDKNNLVEREQHWIDNTLNKYNIDPIAYSSLGRITSEETKHKLSQSRMGRFNGKDNPFYGKHHTQETIDNMKQKLSVLMSGNNNPFYGKHHTNETKQILSIKNMGKKQPSSFCEKQKGNCRGAKSYIITYPNGETIIVHNLGKFCDEHNLCRSNTYTAVSSGHSYKKYKFTLHQPS